MLPKSKRAKQLQPSEVKRVCCECKHHGERRRLRDCRVASVRKPSSGSGKGRLEWRVFSTAEMYMYIFSFDGDNLVWGVRL